MAGGRFDSLVTEGFLCLADILAGELGAHKAPEIMGLDIVEANLVGIAADNIPNGNR